MQFSRAYCDGRLTSIGVQIGARATAGISGFSPGASTSGQEGGVAIPPAANQWVHHSGTWGCATGLAPVAAQPSGLHSRMKKDVENSQLVPTQLSGMT